MNINRRQLLLISMSKLFIFLGVRNGKTVICVDPNRCTYTTTCAAT